MLNTRVIYGKVFMVDRCINDEDIQPVYLQTCFFLKRTPFTTSLELPNIV